MTAAEFQATLARAQRDVLVLALNARKHLGKGNVRRLSVISSQLDDFRGDAEKAFRRKANSDR